MRRSRLLIPAVAGALILAAGITGYLYLEPGTGNRGLPDRRPAFSLPDLDGDRRHVSEWEGKVLLINFWATWCGPCRREIPRLIRAQDRWGDAGLQVLGVAVDSAGAVAPYAREMGIDYPVLIAGTDGIRLSEAYGDDVGALPYSVVVDRQGRIRATHTGELHDDDLRAMLRGHLGGAVAESH